MKLRTLQRSGRKMPCREMRESEALKRAVSTTRQVRTVQRLAVYCT